MQVRLRICFSKHVVSDKTKVVRLPTVLVLVELVLSCSLFGGLCSTYEPSEGNQAYFE